ncbi:TAXI family TRAP transporter solute-binding subunit [Aerophototrophica crusticola]|uniref:TAXI family TRAP transporter solute-binding subunit n=1 Tax=Aerophototrophica crusticola TaxID=1709002 RepID=A0A858R6W8_9PROT|nr:TAXI family TRAP transporter solute-binding subunit [Rhodospirillaceae bacterium B3]
MSFPPFAPARRLGILAASLAFLAFPAAAQTKPSAPDPAPAPARAPVVLGTGAVTGLYYPVGGALCRVMNDEVGRNGPRCLVEATEGSVENLTALRAGLLDFALVQSDWQYQALKGEGRFAAAGPFADLRAVMSLHAETLTILARPEAGVTGPEALAGKRVSLGPKGSALRGLAETVLAAAGAGKFAETQDLPSPEAVAALCEGRVDVAVFAVGHPNGAIRDAVTDCGAVPVPLAGDAMRKLLAERPWFVTTRIPARLYPGIDTDIPTVGLIATLVTTAKADESLVHALVKAVLDEFDTLRGEHPALEGLQVDTLANLGRSAPLHPGAVAALKEAGLAP